MRVQVGRTRERDNPTEMRLSPIPVRDPSMREHTNRMGARGRSTGGQASRIQIRDHFMQARDNPTGIRFRVNPMQVWDNPTGNNVRRMEVQADRLRGRVSPIADKASRTRNRRSPIRGAVRFRGMPVRPGGMSVQSRPLRVRVSRMPIKAGRMGERIRPMAPRGHSTEDRASRMEGRDNRADIRPSRLWIQAGPMRIKMGRMERRASPMQAQAGPMRERDRCMEGRVGSISARPGCPLRFPVFPRTVGKQRRRVPEFLRKAGGQGRPVRRDIPGGELPPAVAGFPRSAASRPPTPARPGISPGSCWSAFAVCCTGCSFSYACGDGWSFFACGIFRWWAWNGPSPSASPPG